MIFFFPLPSVYPFGVLNCYSCRYHRSAMAEILHIQLKIPLHESKREKEKEWQPHIYIYIYTHHQLTIGTYACRRYWRRTKTNSRPVTPLLFSLVETTVASHQQFFIIIFFFFYDTRDVVLQMTLISKRETEKACTLAYKESVITRFEVDEDAPSCCSVRERATSYYRSRVAAAALVRKQDEHPYYSRVCCDYLSSCPSTLQTRRKTSTFKENYHKLSSFQINLVVTVVIRLCLEGLVQLNITSTSSLVYPKSLVLIRKLLSYSIKDIRNRNYCCFCKEIEQTSREKKSQKEVISKFDLFEQQRSRNQIDPTSYMCMCVGVHHQIIYAKLDLSSLSDAFLSRQERERDTGREREQANNFISHLTIYTESLASSFSCSSPFFFSQFSSSFFLHRSIHQSD